MLIYTGACALLLVAIGLYSALSLLVFVAQSIIAFSLLEVVNYVEHYGLERGYDGARYERVKRTHSWDSSRQLTNYLLINLQRHADHHAAPMKTYPQLEPSQEAPQLPGGYAAMVLLALVPPLWFRRIDPMLPPTTRA
jgi:alkane 1-monooxygenase